MGGRMGYEPQAVLRRFHVGVDFGQSRDHSAIVVVEQRVEFAGVVDRSTYEPHCQRRLLVRLVNQVPLQVSYSEVAQGVVRLSHVQELEEAGGLTVCVDGSGLGVVVAKDLIGGKVGGRLYRVVLTDGQVPHVSDGVYYVPRPDLLLGVLQAVEGGMLGVSPGIRQWEVLRQELLSMRRKTMGMRVRQDAGRSHDDLVFALGFALYGVRENVLPERGDLVRERVRRLKWPFPLIKV